MKFKQLLKGLIERNEEGKPETTKKFADATPGQPPVVFTPPAEVDGVKIAAELDPAGGIEHNIKHALSRQDTDVDGDVDDQDTHTPDEVPQDDKKSQTLHMLKKGAAERAHTKKGVAYESVHVDEAMTPQQKTDFDRMMAGAMSRAAYNAKWKKPLKSDSKVIYGKNFKEETEVMVEKLTASDDMGKWIDDFQKSDAPQFAGKSKEERRKMAIAAKMGADRDAGVKEDLDEAVTQDAVVKLLVKYGNNPSDAKKMVSKEFAYAVKTYPNAPASKIAEIIRSLDEAYRKPTQAEIDADRKKDQHGKPRTSASSKSLNKKVYANHMGRLKEDETEQIDEAEDKTVSRLKTLVRFGLMDKSKLPLLSRAIQNLDKGQVTNPTERKILFELLNELIGVVTGDDAMFAKVRMSVQNEDFDAEE